MTMFWTTLLSTLILTASTGTALGAALGLTGLIILHYFADGATSLAINAVWNILNEFTLSAIPLFIIMGEILLESGVSKKIYNSLSGIFKRIPGGLLHTNIAVCTVFGAIVVPLYRLQLRLVQLHIQNCQKGSMMTQW